MDREVKDFLCCMYNIGNNDNIQGIIYLNSLINFASDGKSFCFHWDNIDGMMKHLFSKTKEWIDICNWYSNAVSNTYIRNNNNRVGIWWCVEHKIIKFAEMDSFALFVVAISFVKWKITRKNVFFFKLPIYYMECVDSPW